MIETSRTYLRNWTADDLDALTSLFGDAEIMADIGDGKPLSSEKIHTLLVYFLDHYEKHGFGPLMVIDKKTSEAIGINGIKYLPSYSHPDLGFAFLKKYREQGLGFETSKAVLDFALSTLKLKDIGATVLPRNLASKNLLKKLGFVYKETVVRNLIPTEIFTFVP